MPTFEPMSAFARDYDKLTSAQQAAFNRAVGVFRDDLAKGDGFRPGLRVKKMAGHDGVWEMTWASDGRATFHYGDVIREGHQHVVWRRIGTHEIFANP